MNNWFREEVYSPKLCDANTRVWCCRISMIMSVALVLFSMIYQLWSYYNVLIRDMDDLSDAKPSIVGIVRWCNATLVYQWPYNLCSASPEHIVCTIPEFSNPLSFLGYQRNSTVWYSNMIEGCHHELFVTDPDIF